MAASAPAVLVPCFWQPRIYAGDLSSHIYNAWLATLVEKGQVSGLILRPLTTNMLFDVILETLFKGFGAAWAQRIAVVLVVLIFASGLFLYLRSVAGRWPWFLIPAIAMLSYGWVFHMGFLNFLLALGLSLAALALASKSRPGFVAVGGVLLAIAYLAHSMPVAWAIGLFTYRRIGRALPPRRRAWLFGAAVLGLVGLRLALAAKFRTGWSASQFTYLTGADQFWFADPRTSLCSVLMLIAWAALLVRLGRAKSPVRWLLGFRAQILLLHVFAIVLLPNQIFLPAPRYGFTYIAGRLSLLLAVCVCALAASARPHMPELALMAAACAWFFGLLYADGAALNRLEDRMTAAVQTLPAGSRVVAPLTESRRAPQLLHMIDRVCVERCFSYANYEPVTSQFRVQLDQAHPGAAAALIAPDYPTTVALQAGQPRPRAGLPGYYQIRTCGPDLCAALVPFSPAPLRSPK